MEDPNPRYQPPRGQPTCSSCYFWQEERMEEDVRGRLWNRIRTTCRRYAPRDKEGAPETKPTHWCGDHKLKQEGA